MHLVQDYRLASPSPSRLPVTFFSPPSLPAPPLPARQASSMTPPPLLPLPARQAVLHVPEHGAAEVDVVLHQPHARITRPAPESGG